MNEHDTKPQSDVAELDRVIAELDAPSDSLPEAAIRAAREQRGRIIPRLIRVLRDAAAATRAGHPPTGNAHFYALYLLAEFRATEALPAVVDIISLPGEATEDLFGDAVTTDLARVLATLAADRLDVLDRLILEPAVDEYVRWGAASAVVHLVRDGELSREAGVARLAGHLRTLVARGEDNTPGFLICELERLAPAEARAEIEETFTRGLVDPLLIDLTLVEESIAAGDAGMRERFDEMPPAAIDTIETLRSWHAFGGGAGDPGDMTADDLLGDDDEYDWLPEPSSTLVREQPRVGRNDPCPCGSGRKHKKCCGAPE